MQRKLTDRQKEILDYLTAYTEARGFPPSIREIGAEFGIRSLRGVTVHLEALAKKGWIERGRTPRSIRILPLGTPAPSQQDLRVPLVATNAPGTPVLASENIEGYLQVPFEILRRSDTPVFALRVKGDSMLGDHILGGDIAIISEQPTAQNGDIVAALTGDDETIKLLKVDTNDAGLRAANVEHSPRILGRAIGLIRGY